MGVGLTLMSNDSGVLIHPVALAITVMVPILAVFCWLLRAVNGAILPVPLAARPIEGLLFVQLKTVPVTLLVKFTAAVVAALHNV